MNLIRPIHQHNNLKTCPFCGAPAEVVDGIVAIAIRCLNPECGADIMFYRCEHNVEDTIEHYNRRAVRTGQES